MTIANLNQISNWKCESVRYCKVKETCTFLHIQLTLNILTDASNNVIGKELQNIYRSIIRRTRLYIGDEWKCLSIKPLLFKKLFLAFRTNYICLLYDFCLYNGFLMYFLCSFLILVYIFLIYRTPSIGE